MAITLLDDWTFEDNGDPSGNQIVPSAGANRVMVLAYCGANFDLFNFGWAVTPVVWGDEAVAGDWKSGSQEVNQRQARYIAVFDEASIAGRGDNTIDWSATNITTHEFWGWATYAGVAQTGLDSLVNDATNDLTTSETDFPLTTTSSSGDRIIVIGGNTWTARTVTDWDTLTEKHSQNTADDTNAKYFLGEGNGGDASTLIVTSSGARSNFSSIVLPQYSSGSAGSPTPVINQYYSKLLSG